MRLRRMRRQWISSCSGRKLPDAERSGLAEIAIPTFGYKAHTSSDRRFRLIRCWDITDASCYDGRLLREGLLDPTNTGAGVWADTAYRSERTRPGCSATASSAISTGADRPDGRSRRTSAVAMPDAPATGRRSSTSARSRSGPWDWRFARSGWHEPAPASGWPTSPTTSGDWYSCRAASPPDVASRGPSAPTAEAGASKPRRQGNLRPHHPIPAVKRRFRPTMTSETGLVEVPNSSKTTRPGC